MLARPCLALHAVCLGVLMVPGPVWAQESNGAAALSEMPLPGGLRAALAVLNDPVPPDRSQFLVEVIRRTYSAPIAVRNDPRHAGLRALLAHLERTRRGPVRTGPLETLPLPLSPATWTDGVFGGHATPDTLVSAILESRHASLLYYGLLSLDGPTRAWMASQPALIADIASRHAPAFAVAAAGLRVVDDRVRVPGGDEADAAWEAMVGRRVSEPADFIRALLAQDDGRLAYFLTAMGELTREQIVFALDVDSGHQVTALRRLRLSFDRVTPGWKVDQRALWRPRRDPALLLADLAADERGRPVLPGTREFWTAVFASDAGVQIRVARESDARPASEPDEFTWLCEQVFTGTPAEQRRRYEAVLFASRVVKHVTSDVARDALETVRAVAAYPALVAVLERARLVDVPTYAIAARRAARLSAIGGDDRRLRALSQFQGTVALLARMVSRGSLAPDAFQRAVASLSAVELNDRGEYAGALVRWLGAWLASVRAGEMPSTELRPGPSTELSPGPSTRAGPGEADATDEDDEQLLRLIAGRAPVPAQYVEWEGTRYRLDLAAAETARLARLLGEHPRAHLSAARALVEIADSLGSADLARERLRHDAQRLEGIAAAIGSERPDWEQALVHAAERGDLRAAHQVAPALRVVADDLFARGLVELAYAAAMGQPEQGAISVGDIARRHDFGVRADAAPGTGPWLIPVADVSPRGYRISGSLLGLDAPLAEYSLTRVSTKAPLRKPTISSEERRVFIASVPLVEPDLLSDAGGDRIVTAIREGRAQVAAIRTGADAAALAEAIRLGPIRRTLLPWVVARDPSRLPSFFSPAELLWIGLGHTRLDPDLHAWGVSAQARLGCLCLEVIDRRPADMLAGRVNAGMLASGFPDLSLRLAELLSDLHMPAALLGNVLAPATFDFVNGAASRDEDDRRGLVEFVLALRVDRLEEYLAMLTTDGPLVPPREEDRLQTAAGRHQ